MHSSGGVKYLLTASHCGPVGTTVLNGAYARIGTVAYNYGTLKGLDYELIKPDSGSTGTYVYDGVWNDSTGYAKPQVPFVATRAGDIVCASGSFSGAQCLAHIKYLNVPVTSDDGNHYTVDEVDADDLSHALAGNGDSGGPVFQATNNYTQDIPKGIIQGIDPYTILNCNGVPSSSTRKCSSRIYITSWTRMNAATGILPN